MGIRVEGRWEVCDRLPIQRKGALLVSLFPDVLTMSGNHLEVIGFSCLGDIHLDRIYILSLRCKKLAC